MNAIIFKLSRRLPDESEEFVGKFVRIVETEEEVQVVAHGEEGGVWYDLEDNTVRLHRNGEIETYTLSDCTEEVR